MSQHTPVRATEITYNEGILRLAAIHDKQVEFRYAKGDGGVIELRALKPESVKIIKPGKSDEHVTVTGYDPDRDAVRHYRLDRIKGDVRIAA